MHKTSSLLDKLKEKKLKLVSSESCTGGLLAATLTTIPGSSDVYDRGFITYSNQAKTEMLDVSKELIDKHGAVSAEVAAAMAKGALKNVSADVAIAITGIAGPKTSEHKPVGLVYIAVSYKNKVRVIENHISGSRIEIQAEAVSRAFDLIDSVV